MTDSYLVRAVGEGPDLVWVAVVEYTPETGAGLVKHQGPLEGDTEAFEGDAALEAVLRAFVDRGHQVDRI